MDFWSSTGRPRTSHRYVRRKEGSGGCKVKGGGEEGGERKKLIDACACYQYTPYFPSLLPRCGKGESR